MARWLFLILFSPVLIWGFNYTKSTESLKKAHNYWESHLNCLNELKTASDTPSQKELLSKALFYARKALDTTNENIDHLNEILWSVKSVPYYEKYREQRRLCKKQKEIFQKEVDALHTQLLSLQLRIDWEEFASDLLEQKNHLLKQMLEEHAILTASNSFYTLEDVINFLASVHNFIELDHKVIHWIDQQQLKEQLSEIKESLVLESQDYKKLKDHWIELSIVHARLLLTNPSEDFERTYERFNEIYNYIRPILNKNQRQKWQEVLKECQALI